MVERIFTFFALTFLLAVSAPGVPARSEVDRGFSVANFKEMFPEAVQDGFCYLLRLDRSKIVAVGTPSSSGHIELIFVNAHKKSAAIEIAKRLTEEIPLPSVIRPFEGNEASVAIIFSSPAQNHPDLSSILRSSSQVQNVRFIGWRGNRLRAQMEYAPSFDRRKRHRTLIEVLLDLRSSTYEHVEFHVVKGRLDPEDAADFINDRTKNRISFPTELTPRERYELISQFPSHELVLYSKHANFCMVNRRKVYHAGTIDGVSSFLRSKQSVAKFDFPRKDMRWPSQLTTQQNPATEDNLPPQKGATGGSSPAIASARPDAADQPDQDTSSSLNNSTNTDDKNRIAAVVGDPFDQGETPEPAPPNVQNEISRYVQTLQAL